MSLLLCSGWACPAWAAATADARPHAAPPGPLTADWMDEILEIIERLLKILDGVAAPVSSDPSVAMTQLTDYYNAYGISGNLTPEERALARLDVEQAYSMTFQAPPDISPGTIDRFRKTLRRMYADLGGDPASLGP